MHKSKPRDTWYAAEAAPNMKPAGKLLRLREVALHDFFPWVALLLLVPVHPRITRRPKRRVPKPNWSAIITLLFLYSIYIYSGEKDMSIAMEQ